MEIPILRPERTMIIIWISFPNAADERSPECWHHFMVMSTSSVEVDMSSSASCIYAVANPSGKYKILS